MISKIPVNNQIKGFSEGDILVLFGELFQRGYGNGLVEEAESRGMKVIYTTVGRREKDPTTGKENLRALKSEEIKPGTFINVPLEAGFDMEPNSSGQSPVDMLAGVKLTDWESVKLDPKLIQESRKKGEERFRTHVREMVKLLKAHLTPGKNILFAHLMAGGVPRAKVILPLMNRAFKGTGDRHMASKQFWDSSIGQFCSQSFDAVTADTFQILLEETAEIHSQSKSQGLQVSYLGYGYHGTEVYIGDQLQWQTYTPYLQGWAKMRLEQYAVQAQKRGIQACIYNCPEILTNSSSIFLGVEVSLYPLLLAFKKLKPEAPITKRVWDQCQKLLKEGNDLGQILKEIDHYLHHPIVREHCNFKQWPQHNRKDQMELMIGASDRVISLHVTDKELITAVLSEVVFKSCGKLMLADAFKSAEPIRWIGHDAVVAVSN